MLWHRIVSAAGRTMRRRAARRGGACRRLRAVRRPPSSP